jgi:hypothetical protein
MKVFAHLFTLTYIILVVWGCKDKAKMDVIEKTTWSNTSIDMAKDSIGLKNDTLSTPDKIKDGVGSIVKPKATPANESKEKDIITPQRKKKKVKVEKKIAKISFDNPVFDFGMIVEGEVVDHRFEFTNAGNAPLSIKKTSVTCGCTVPSYPFVDIGPGDTGYIGVQFNSTGKMGNTTAEITIYSNASSPEMILTMKGNVETKK